MTHEKIQKAARKKVKAKKEFYIVAFIFGFISIIILAIMLFIRFTYDPPIGEYFWMLIPIGGFALALGIWYLSLFGIPGVQFTGDKDWEENQMKYELLKLYRKKGIPLPADPELTDEDRLELQELERLQQKWGNQDDLV